MSPMDDVLRAYQRGREEGRAESAARIVALEQVVAQQRDTPLMRERDAITRWAVKLEKRLGIYPNAGGVAEPG